LSFKNGIQDKIEFAVTEEQKDATTAVRFVNCQEVDFIDSEVLKRFPRLNGISIYDSHIQILQNIFTADLKMIQNLNLSCNRIKILKAKILDELINLKWVSLYGNQIEEIEYPIFSNNKKLEFVDFSNNKIESLNPLIFDGLQRLEEVGFYRNPSIDRNFNKNNIKMLNVGLKPLFDSYLAKLELVSLRLSITNFFLGSPPQNTLVFSVWRKVGP
jgi:Leucine-rich repeat (LRR) protein